MTGCCETRTDPISKSIIAAVFSTINKRRNAHTAEQLWHIFCLLCDDLKNHETCTEKVLCMCVLFFSRTSVPNIFPSNTYVASYPKNIRCHAYRSSRKVLLLSKKFQKTWTCRKILVNLPNIKLCEKPVTIFKL
jgi:hypothetical protein